MSRPLMPAPPRPMGAPGKAPADDGSEPGEPPAKVQRMTHGGACAACKRKKLRCTGERPRCKECVRKNLEDCDYTVESKAQAFERQLREALGEAEKARADAEMARTYASTARNEVHRWQTEVFTLKRILTTLASRSPEAQNLVERLENGADAASLLEHVQSAALLLDFSRRPDTNYRQSPPLYIDSSYLFSHTNNANNDYLQSLLLGIVMSEVRLTHGETGTTTHASTSSVPPPTDSRHDSAPSHEQPAYHYPYSKAKLIEPRLATAQITRWTNVSEDEDFLRALIQVYLLYAHPYYPVFHKDIFIRALTTGEGEYCSKLLVNAVLACASHGFADKKDRSEFWKPGTHGYKFMAEARRLMEIEVSSNGKSLATIQAGVIMGITHWLNGSDKVGWDCWARAVALGNDVNLFSEIDPNLKDEEQLVRRVTAWGVFAQQAHFSFYFVKQPLLKSPPVAKLPEPNQASQFFGEILIMYPGATKPMAMNLGPALLAVMELRKEMNRITQMALQKVNGESSLNIDRAMEIYARLKAWHGKLPEPLTAKRAVLPLHLIMHMQYHDLVIMIMRPLISVEKIFSDATETSSILDYVDHSPGQLVNKSMVCLETLLHMFYHRHNFDAYYVFIMQVLGRLAQHKLDQARHANGDEESRKAAQTTVGLCLKGLHDLGKNFFLSEVTFHVIRMDLNANEMEVFKTYVDITMDDNRKRVLQEQVLSEWPVDVPGITEDVEKYRLDRLLPLLIGQAAVPGSGSR